MAKKVNETSLLTCKNKKKRPNKPVDSVFDTPVGSTDTNNVSYVQCGPFRLIINI